MKKGYLKFLSLLLIFQMLFGGMAFDARAMSVIESGNPNSLALAIAEILKIIKDIIYVAAKNRALKTVVSEVNSTVGSGEGGPKFITDWRDALQIQPDKATETQMKNFFTTLGGGREGNYMAPDGATGYAGNILGAAQQSVMDTSVPQMLNMAEYGINNPEDVLSQKNLKAFMAVYGSSGKIGNAAQATLVAQDAKAKFESINNRLAEAQAVAYGGYYSSMSGGKVATPGSNIRDLVSGAQNMTFTSLATAKNIQETAAALILRTVKSINKGIGDAKKAAEGGVGATAGAYGDGLKASFGNLNIR